MTEMTKAGVVGLIAFGLLAGCNDVPTDRVENTTRGGSRPIWTDPETGCDYIAPSGYFDDGSMPRISSDGFHVLCAEQKAALSKAGASQ